MVGAALLSPGEAASVRGAPPTLATEETPDPVARALLADPMSPDGVALALGMDAADVLRRIGHLEAAGVIARYPDGRYGAGRRR
jgi:predicted Rossmann fold nucleotide-binding protein DprA/Smf involved in DNA uptake